MNPEWLPEWWVQSAVCQWLMHGGRMLVPSLIHACTFAVELGMLRLTPKLPDKQRVSVVRLVWLLIFIHLLLVVAGTAALDGGASYSASAFYWGLIVSAMAAAVLRRTRATPEQPDPYARHIRPDFAKLPNDPQTKGQHET